MAVLNEIILFVIVAIVVFFIAATGIKIVRPWQKGLIERMGKYQRTADSGLTIIVPFIEKMIKVDMREQVVDVPPQGVITKDNVVVEVDAVIYYMVTDPVQVTYNVANYYMAATKLAQTNLRNLIGDLALDETLTSRELINIKLREILDADADKYKKLTVAKGEAEAIQTVFGAIHVGRPTNDLIAIKYLETLEKIADG